jgi:hypothetical protein
MTKIVSELEKHQIGHLLLDMSKQAELFATPGHPRAWMLDYVYAPKLREELFPGVHFRPLSAFRE